METIGNFTSEALSQTKNSLSPGLSTLLHDHKVSNGADAPGSSRSDVRLGIPSSKNQPIFFSPPQSMLLSPGPPSLLDEEDMMEFKEEDVWAAETIGTWPELATEKESIRDTDKIRHECRIPSLAQGNNGAIDTTGARSDTLKVVTNGLHRLSLHNREPGLSAAFSEVGPGLSLASLSPITRSQISSRETAPIRFSTASQMIPQLGSADFSARNQVERHQSAPVNVPDWSKILGLGKQNVTGNVFMDEDEDEDEERLPPHELLAREYAKSQATTFSMCQGVGRTLKGRDLSRVRNAVLRQTGFLD